MAKNLWMALVLAISAGLWAAPAMAQSEESDNLDSIRRGGAEGAADTTLGSKGLVFTTDGFSLRLTTRVQFRLTYQNEVAGGEGQDGSATNGRDFINFRVRRAKTGFEGHIFEKEFQYKLLLSWVSESNIVEEAWFRWAVMQYINITAGQTKLQWNWEEASSSANMQFVERSYVNEVFNHGWAKGITLDGQIGEDTPWLKYWFGVYNGVLAGANDFRNADVAVNTEVFSALVDNEMMINLRLETHPLGEVARGMYDARGEDEYDQVLFAIGLGVNWFMSGVDTAAAGIRGDDSGLATAPNGHARTSQDTWSITLDGHFRWHGLSVDIAYFWRITDFHNRGANSFDPTSQVSVGNVEDSGFTFEVAYMIIPDMFNVGIRFNMLNAEDFWQSGGTGGLASNPRAFGFRPDTTEIGVSANWFIHGDNLKMTFDILWVGQQVPFGADNGGGSDGLNVVYNVPPDRTAGGGSLGSSEADHNDLWIVRLQLQWIF
jgi:phosphate-selective porin OprO/OprP